MKMKIYCLVWSSLILCASCAKWTDVKPRIELRDNMVFANETSVEEALNGVYAGMTLPEGYGQEMTWGMLDVMGMVYDPLTLRDYEVDASMGNFDDSQTQRVIEDAWKNSYRCIAEANHFLASIEHADPAIFTGANMNLFKGEALALRALLHFDILRLFGPTATSDQWSSQSVIPYVTTYSSQVPPRISGALVAVHILDDLAEAEELMAADPIRGAMSPEGLRARKVRMNYYAVKALQARVHMWIGDQSAALAAAQVILDVVNDTFPWTLPGDIQSAGGQPFDYILASQNIFSLYVNKLGEYTRGILSNIPREGTGGFSKHYSLSEAQRQAIYEASGSGVTDYRYIYMTGTQTSDAFSTILHRKLHQTIYSTLTGSEIFAKPYAANRIPLIKTSELFYIAAECLSSSDPAKAIELLNTVRTNRGISVNLPLSGGPSEVLAEIRKEYIKEFPCEGQIFFYKKRTGELNVVWPLPEWELQYGY